MSDMEAADMQKLKDEIAAEKARADKAKAEMQAQIEKAKAEAKVEMQAQIEKAKAEAKAEGKAEAKAEAKAEMRRVVALKVSGDYWDTFNQVWKFEAAPYSGCFSTASQLRQSNHCNLYYEEEIVHILTDGRTVEAILEDEKAPSIFEKDAETSVSTVSRASAYFEKNGSDGTGDKNHEMAHARNMLGENIKSGDKPRAHTFPADEDFYKWWWPMYQLVTGTHESIYDPNAIKKLASMRTCKFVFVWEHNLIYDNLKSGVVCTIPIFESMEDMAKWQYKDGYKVLIIADSPSSYKRLVVTMETEYAKYAHIRIASPAEVANATNLLAEMMKVMADSLVSNWEGHYSEIEDEGKQKKMLTRMRDMLAAAGGVDIPIFANQDGQTPKLYLIDYAVLYEDNPEGAKYITDPFPALIKSAVNLSFFTTQKSHPNDTGCTFLPGCPSSVSSGEEESVRSVDIVGFLDGSAPEASFQKLIGKEIELPFVSDDQFDDDDDNDNDDITQ